MIITRKELYDFLLHPCYLDNMIFIYFPLCSIAVCSVVDDPYPAMDLLSPWLRHQAVCFEQSKLFVHSNLDKMLRMCTLTFHSALGKNYMYVYKCIHILNRHNWYNNYNGHEIMTRFKFEI